MKTTHTTACLAQKQTMLDAANTVVRAINESFPDCGRQGVLRIIPIMADHVCRCPTEVQLATQPEMENPEPPQEGECFECREFLPLHRHHVVPKVVGGRQTILLCENCHGKVHGREMTLHSELTRQGLMKAKQRGVTFGRPRGSKLKLPLEECRRYIAEGRGTIWSFAKDHGLSESSLRRALAA